MLYLAEVLQKRGGIIGGNKGELKLLACQRSEQSWSATNEETIPTEEANKYSPGTLLLVDLTANKQVQRIQEAGRPLVSILQNFSRLQEKFKTQEEEIEQWKQSLTYQSQELNRREMEMEARREQLQQMEEDFEQLEQQKQEIELSREEVQRLREEFERSRQEMEGAWEQLRGQKRQLEERQTELQQATVLGDEQAQAIYAALDALAHSEVSPASIDEQLDHANGMIAQHQEVLNQHWQTLEQHQSTLQERQQSLEHQAQDVHRQWEEWHQAQTALEQAKADLKVQQSQLHLKQDYAQTLGMQLQYQDELYQQLYRLSEGLESVNISSQFDTEALEKLPIDELQAMVNELHREFEKSSQFVNGQEEELDLKQKDIEALQARIQQANDYDRMTLEAELADERDAYQFLNETLVGQRRNLKEKEGILKRHQSILARRQGHADPLDKGGMDLGAIFTQMEGQRQQQAEELQKVENQIEQIRGSVEQIQSMIQAQSQELDTQRHALKQREETLKHDRATTAELAGRIALYQESLQPHQNVIDQLRQKLEAMKGMLSQLQESGAAQQGVVDQVRQIISSLTN